MGPLGPSARSEWVLGSGLVLGTQVLPYVLWEVWGLSFVASTVLLAVSALLLPYALVRLPLDRPIRFARLAAIIAFLLALQSLFTWLWNGLTDEYLEIPGYLGMILQGTDPYSHLLTIHGHLAGEVTSGYDLDFPLASFFLVPGVDYRWFEFALWGILVVLFWERPVPLSLVGGTYFALVAVNGYSDVGAMLLLVLGLEQRLGRWSGVAVVLASGIRQFALALAFLLLGTRRRWKELLGVGLGTALILAPFFLWAPVPFVCNALLFQLAPGCPTNPQTNTTILGHFLDYGINLNYLAWPLFVLALYPAESLRWVRRWIPGGGAVLDRLFPRSAQVIPGDAS